MSSVEIIRLDHTKYGSTSLTIKGAAFSLKECEILEIEDTKYGYQNVVVKLPEKKITKMLEFEEEVNDYLYNECIDKIKFVYGNRIYAKKRLSISKKHLESVKLNGVFINNESKPFPQIWVR